MPFKPGQSGNPGGKKPGVLKDKKWATLQFWFEKLTDDLESIPVTERVKAELKMIELILAKRSLPSDVQDSVNTAEQTMRILKELESGNGSRSETTGNPPSLATGPSDIQAIPPSERD